MTEMRGGEQPYPLFLTLIDNIQYICAKSIDSIGICYIIFTSCGLAALRNIILRLKKQKKGMKNVGL